MKKEYLVTTRISCKKFFRGWRRMYSKNIVKEKSAFQAGEVAKKIHSSKHDWCNNCHPKVYLESIEKI